MGWKHIFEHETGEGFSLDLAEPEAKLAVEVDGPSHYLKDLSSGESVDNGATRYKTRQLRTFGWTVAHISFFGLTPQVRVREATASRRQAR